MEVLRAFGSKSKIVGGVVTVGVLVALFYGVQATATHIRENSDAALLARADQIGQDVRDRIEDRTEILPLSHIKSGWRDEGLIVPSTISEAEFERQWEAHLENSRRIKRMLDEDARDRASKKFFEEYGELYALYLETNTFWWEEEVAQILRVDGEITIDGVVYSRDG